jgi:glycosyltransferase involved in cell wall biosynthesis
VSSLPVDHLDRVEVVGAALRCAFRHPVTSLRVLAEVVRRSARGNRLEQAAAALVGLAWTTALDDREAHLHVHFGWVAATAAWACTRITGQPYSVVLHAFELHAARYEDGFAPVPLRAAHRVFAISAFDAELVRSRWQVSAEVLHMGVDRTWLDAPPLQAPVPGRIVAVGSLVPQKGHEVLVRAVAAASTSWDLTIVGEGPGRRVLEALGAELGVQDRVHLVGWVDGDEVRERYDGAWVACLACVVAPDGERDGIPVALMEAMARGVPVVTSELGGIPELVDGAGVLVPPGDHLALAAAFDCLSDPEARRRIGERGRRRVAQGFSVASSAIVVLDTARRSAEGASRDGRSAAP